MQYMSSQRISQFLKNVDNFDVRFPEFNFPLQKEVLFRIAAGAAKMLGSAASVVEAMEGYCRKVKDALASCLSLQDNLEDQRKFKTDQTLWPHVAVTILLNWLKAEADLGFITIENAMEILGMTDDMPTYQGIANPVANNYDIFKATDPKC